MEEVNGIKVFYRATTTTSAMIVVVYFVVAIKALIKSIAFCYYSTRGAQGALRDQNI